jgi:hypothetical protein
LKEWLRKLTSVEQKDKGELPMNLQKSLLIYSARTGCAGSTLEAGLDIHADAKISMNARYAYYLSGTLVPPAIDDTYAYFGVQPDAYLGIRMNGNAILRYESDRKKLIDTLSYPGLSVRGIAAVGPTLDLWGQIRGQVKLSGQMQIGAGYTFQAAEVYWPQNGDSASYQKIRDLVGNVETPNSGLDPRFSASVKAEANIDVLLTPEAKMGIKINPGIMDAQLVGFVNNTLRFHAEAQPSRDNGGSSFSYDYGVYFLYNMGIGSYGNFLSSALGIGWNLPPRKLFAQDITVKLYPRGNSKRAISPIGDAPPLPYAPRKGLLNGMDAHGLETADSSKALSGYNAFSPLVKRLSPSDITTFAAGLLQCPNATDCNGPGAVDPGAGGSEDNCPISGSGKPSRRAPTCPVGGGQNTCANTRPRLMCKLLGDKLISKWANIKSDNCKFMADEQLTAPGSSSIPGQQVDLHSVCYNIRGVMQRDGVANEYELTFNPEDANTHRSAVCPTGFCTITNDDLQNEFEQGDKLTSCDEFPFASTEEGGRPGPGVGTTVS